MITYDRPIKTNFNHGYIYFSDKNHPLAKRSGIIYFHRHVMSIHLGRWIKSDEHVHHIDGNKQNNSVENLFLTTKSEHAKHHHPIINKEVKCEICNNFFFPKTKISRRFCSHECRKKSNFSKKFLVTREELHNDVWSMPTTKVAEKYGVSDKAINKRCKKLEVEKPYRGYWTKVEYGKIKHEIPELKPITLV